MPLMTKLSIRVNNDRRGKERENCSGSFIPSTTVHLSSAVSNLLLLYYLHYYASFFSRIKFTAALFPPLLCIFLRHYSIYCRFLSPN